MDHVAEMTGAPELDQRLVVAVPTSHPVAYADGLSRSSRSLTHQAHKGYRKVAQECFVLSSRIIEKQAPALPEHLHATICRTLPPRVALRVTTSEGLLPIQATAVTVVLGASYTPTSADMATGKAREILIEKLFHCAETNEIAKRLGISDAAVRKRIRTALERMQGPVRRGRHLKVLRGGADKSAPSPATVNPPLRLAAANETGSDSTSPAPSSQSA